ncbi:MAG: nicotinate (nicotinamide) nucleotide adenylyltransferase [Firmicutes bacterium]|nr:nicotinate (nicotinamide) nucleotide adenylyltransferase [Bacillota bacterium]
MRIGLFGGSFSPIHMGHLAVGALVKDFANLDKVAYLPVGVHTEKIRLLPKEHRVNMVKLAIEDNPDFDICLYEVERETYSYTYETLKALSTQHPDWELYFIIGSDILPQIPRKWYQGKQLLSEFKFLVFGRSSQSQIARVIARDPQLKNFQHNLIPVPMRFSFNISSTLIREQVQQGRTIRYLVPWKVEEYIYRHNLYQDGSE